MRKRILSIWTLLGIIFGIGLFVSAIYRSTENYLIFISINSLIMVLGGTFAATMIAYHGRYVMSTIGSLFSIVFPIHLSPKVLNQNALEVIEWAKINSKEGFKAVETIIINKKIKDPIILYAKDLISTGVKGDRLRPLMEDLIECTIERQMIQANILQTMAGFAPGFGMIGTLIGLIIMLDNMGADISQVGPGLALALLTTLYGVLFAQLLFKPAAEKVQQTLEILRHRNIILMESMVLLSEGKTSFEIQDYINRYIAPSNWIDLTKTAK
ncbi:flagellar motor protein MotA [Candidatus Marinamargulisbacteria bacterium SCGC AG-343-D04]|nr:flagellar motor protein MotA [Candidatus Marinamargulisbacteria bacterium SCGC AG-343-D04]